MAKTTLVGDKAITHIKTIFGIRTVLIKYDTMGGIANERGETIVNFTSLNNKKHHEELVKIVDEIFDKMHTKVDAKSFTLDNDKLVSLNDFLLKLAETGLSKEVLMNINAKYNKKFSDTLTIKCHEAIKKSVESFNGSFQEKITSAQSQENLNAEWEQQQQKKQQQEELHALQEKNDHLARNCFTKLWNKKTIEKNRLKIDNLERKLWDSGSVASSEDREIRRQFGKEGVQISRGRGGQIQR